MSEDVKPRRRYDSTRRQAQAAQTRQDILGAAQRLFLERGYAGTTLAAIAQAAGVVVETIYRAYGSKAELFKAVVQAAVAGGAARAQVPVEQRPAIAAVIAEPDPHRQLKLYAATQPGIHARAGPLMRVLVGAAAADPELAELWTQIEDERRTGQGRLVQLLADRGVLRPELPVEEARDLLWILCSLAVYDLLVLRCGWSPERYRDWLASALARELLPHRQPPRRPAPPRPRRPAQQRRSPRSDSA
jgi:AcrR family transcriptional regulator